MSCKTDLLTVEIALVIIQHLYMCGHLGTINHWKIYKETPYVTNNGRPLIWSCLMYLYHRCACAMLNGDLNQHHFAHKGKF